jgi:AraC-like DNA-binding protein
MVVEQVFRSLGFEPVSITLGEVVLFNEPKPAQMEELNKKLIDVGFALIDNKRSQLINRIKTEVVKWIQDYNFRTTKLKFSAYIEEKLKKDYTYLSNLFSEVEGQNIEQFMILQRIEKVKELLVYDELSLSEIADKTGFSSTAHLSGQFKKMTGFTPSHYKKVKDKKRHPIDEL